MATQNVNLDAWFANTLGGAGNGNGNKMMVGMGTGSWAWQNRLAIQIPRGTLFSGVPSAAAISAFDIRMRTNNGNSGIGGSVHFYLERGLAGFTEYQVVAGQGGVPSGANINQFVSSSGPSSGEWPGPSRDATNRGEYSGSPAADAWIKVPMLAMGRWWYAHPEIANLVLIGVAVDENATAQRCTFYTRESSSVPYAELTAGTNSPPNKPTNPSSTVGSDGVSLTIATKYTDPDGDTSSRYEVLWTPD
jgi:hypothetical protein